MRLRLSILVLLVPAAWSPPATLPQRDALRSPLDPPSASISADGRFVAFASRARLSPEDTNELRDVYVLDRGTGRVTLESAGRESEPWGSDAAAPRISGDGRFVAYEVAAPLSEDGVNSHVRVDIAVRDRQMRTTRRVSVGIGGVTSDGWSRGPAVSSDGRYVAFASTATNLVPGDDANGHGEDVYLADLVTGAIRRVSLDARGDQPATGASLAPAVSRDGRYIAFSSTSRLRGADEDGRFGAARLRGSDDMRRFGETGASLVSNVFVRDTVLETTTLVSAADGGTAANGPSAYPAISADGRFVAFVSSATNLVRDDKNRAADVFLWDARTRPVRLLSRSARSRRLGSGRAGAANAESGHPAISADGRFIVFQSLASDLICARRCGPPAEDINLLWDVFVVERDTHVVTRVSGDADGCWMEASSGASVDATGRTVVFSSLHPMDAGDENADHDLFLRVARWSGL